MIVDKVAGAGARGRIGAALGAGAEEVMALEGREIRAGVAVVVGAALAVIVALAGITITS